MNNVWQYNSNSLSHYGILGMKWGRRKGETTTTKSNKPKPKTISEMTTKELKSASDRMRAENDYKKLMDDRKKGNKSDAQKKQEKVIKDALVEVGGRTIKSVGGDVAKYAVGSTINKILGVNVVKDVPLTKIGKYKQNKAGEKNLKAYKKKEADKKKKKEEKKKKKDQASFENFHLGN